MNSLNVYVRGMIPVPWGSGANEWIWRRKLADEARLVRGQNRLSGISKLTHFSVDIVFFMSGLRIEGADLDNLAKPILDTLFLSRYAQVKDKSLTGALFDVDDDRVFKLALEKRAASADSDAGVDVLISWT